MLLFVRHGLTDSNKDKVFSGKRDNVPLNEVGEEQARLTGEDLRKQNIHIERIIVSPMGRTRRTAEIIAHEIGFPLESIEIDERLVEYDMGEYTGTPHHPLSADELRSGKEVESPYEFQKRIMAVINELKYRPEVILLVSHGAVSRMIQASLAEEDPYDFFKYDPYPNAQVTVLKDI